MNFSVTLPLGCTAVTIIRPEDGTETVLRFDSAAETSATAFPPEVAARIDRWAAHDPASPAPGVADFLVRELGYTAMPPRGTSGAEVRFVYVAPNKGTATLWMNTTSMTSISTAQKDFALEVDGAELKADARVVFPFASAAVDPRHVAIRFKQAADEGTLPAPAK